MADNFLPSVFHNPDCRRTFILYDTGKTPQTRQRCMELRPSIGQCVQFALASGSAESRPKYWNKPALYPPIWNLDGRAQVE